MESNLESNRYESRITWHTMEELPREKERVILHFGHRINVIGYMEYDDYSKDYIFYDDNYEDVLVKNNIVAWGEFEFPTDWDYNK